MNPAHTDRDPAAMMAAATYVTVFGSQIRKPGQT